MPWLRIDTIAGHYDAARRARIGTALQQALHTVGVPSDERFQCFAQHDREDLVFDPHYRGIERGEGFIAIQVTLIAGRTPEKKQALFKAIADGLHSQVGVRREDVLINLVEVARENWSFGNGEALHG
jgi:phenylpyruvate tautomerase PptA (4-oxalocrotonate tautomerase family)